MMKHTVCGVRLLPAIALVLCMGLPGAAIGSEPGPSAVPSGEEAAEETRRIQKKGITVEFDVTAVGQGVPEAPWPLEGADAVVRFRISGSGGNPIPGLYPAAWVDTRKSRNLPDVPGGSEPVACRDKINSFLQGGLAFRPDLDLNTYYLLTLNDKASISVIDPHVDFSITKMVALVRLQSPGEDWVVGRDGKRIYVTMPEADGLAVVDTNTWTVERTVPVAGRPTVVALQPDGRYVWVGNDGSPAGGEFSGVSVVDASAGTVVARIPTGPGHHEIAFTEDSRFAAVTNEGAGSLSLVDVRTLAVEETITTGGAPAGVAYSPESRAFYVTDEETGAVVVVDAGDLKISARIPLDGGVRRIAVGPAGRWAFVLNPRADRLSIIDSAVNRVLHTISVGPEPDAVAFTPAFAYVRSLGTEKITMIGLGELGKRDEVPVLTFPGGQSPPGRSPHRARAPVIVPTPEENTVVVTNPEDRTLYYYMEGMVAPMGSFQSFGRVPRAVMIIDRSLRPSAPGEYVTTVRLPRAGTYDVAFLLDAPFMYHCFTLEVAENPALRKKLGETVRIIPSLAGDRLAPGRANTLKITVTDIETGAHREGIDDIRVLYFLAPGTWQRRVWAREVGKGVYEADLFVPREGVYYIYVESPSQKLRYDDVRHLVVLAQEEGTPASHAAGESPDGAPQETPARTSEEDSGDR